MNKLSLRLFAVLAAIALSLTAFTAKAENPFAATKIVLQLSDGSPAKQTLVLNVANNLIKHYGQDNVDVEIVTFNQGLRLLFKDNVNGGRIDSLTNSGVRFSACQNTVKGMTRALGHPPVLSKNAKPVPAGIVRIGVRTGTPASPRGGNRRPGEKRLHPG